MKTQFLYSATAILFGTMLWLGNSAGPGFVGNGNQTGFTGSSCSSCHGGASFTPAVTITVKDTATLATVTAYQPAKTYQVSITSTGGGTKFGFQGMFIDGTNSTRGSFTAGSGTRVSVVGGREIIEHSSASTSPTFTFYWTAPAAGFGSITWRSGYLAANGNGGDSGDKGVTATATLTEAPVTSIKEVAFASSYTVYPNPVREQLTIQLDINATDEYSLTISNVWGATIAQEHLTLNTGIQTHQIATQDLAAGVYIVTLHNNKGQVASRNFVKE